MNTYADSQCDAPNICREDNIVGPKHHSAQCRGTSGRDLVHSDSLAMIAVHIERDGSILVRATERSTPLGRGSEEELRNSLAFRRQERRNSATDGGEPRLLARLDSRVNRIVVSHLEYWWRFDGRWRG